MKTITKIWYSVQNGGDGSAYPQWMESKELAQLDQDFMDEGWGESCIGYLTIESDGPITIKDMVTTVEDVIEDTLENMEFSDSVNLRKKLEALKKLQERK